MTKEDSEILQNLKTFRDLSANQKAHPALLKEKKIILYAATLLESDNISILKICLEILENFVANEQAHEFLVSTFGVYEALENLSIRARNKYEDIYDRVIEITDILRNSAPPAYNTRNRIRTTKPLKRHQLYLLHIEELNAENLVKLETALLKIKGIISFLIDMELRRCTIRICPKLKISEIIEKLYGKCELKAVIVKKNVKEGTEDYCDILSQSMDKSYLECPEEVHSPKAKAVCAAFTKLTKSGSLFEKVTNFWNESFYW